MHSIDNYNRVCDREFALLAELSSYLEFTVLAEFVSEAWSGVYCVSRKRQWFCHWIYCANSETSRSVLFTNLLYCHSWQSICVALLSSIRYQDCPQCGNSNHHNKVKCAECGVCLGARPGRPKMISDDKKVAQVDPAYKLKCCAHPVDIVMIFAGWVSALIVMKV